MHGAACWSPVLVAAASYTEVAAAVYAAGVAAPCVGSGRDSSDDDGSAAVLLLLAGLLRIMRVRARACMRRSAVIAA